MRLIGTGINRDSEWLEGVSPFKARAPWIGGDLQTVRNTVSGDSSDLAADERLLVSINDKMKLSIAVNRPADTQATSKSILLVHGLGGNESGHYMVTAAQHFLRLGWTTYRMNMRGAGPSRETSSAPYHAGLIEDVREVIVAVSDHAGGAVAALGFSLGGHQLLRLASLGEAPEALQAVVTVSAPLDLAETSHRIEALRNRLYRRYLANVLKDHLADFQHPKVTENPLDLPSVMAIDEAVIAPVFGFEGAEDYYAKMTALPHLGGLDRPTLAIHAADDPWIHKSQYERAAWPFGAPAGALIAGGGGHVGFHASGVSVPWSLHAATCFLNTVRN